ncbi:cupin domain-containing protein [Chryseomicrobium palamuruense]
MQRDILQDQSTIQLVRVELLKGFQGEEDLHVAEQITYIEKGEVHFRVGDEMHHLKTGESVYIGSNVPHQIEVLEHTVLLDIFTPRK